MPDYKKKKKHYRPLKKDKYVNVDEDIVMKKQKAAREKKEKSLSEIAPPKLVMGKKQRRAAQSKVIAVFCAIVVSVFIVLKLLFPVGIIETARHFVSTLGVGDFPKTIAGNEVIDVVKESDYYLVLTCSDVYSVSNSGKVMYNFPHGYNNPVINGSKTRLLVYGQGKAEYDLYINGEKEISGSAESGIICGDVSDSGVFAVASYSKTYASTVTVYNAKGESIYSWNSANDIINSVALSSNGKKMAVSAINSKDGKKYSKVHIFSFKNTDSEKTFDFDDNFVYNLTSSKNGFYIVMNKNIAFYDWKNKYNNDQNSNFKVKFFRTSSNLSTAVFSREDNAADNMIYLFDKKGSSIKHFTFSGDIKDISISGKNIMIYSGSQIILYNQEGKDLGKIECNDLGRRIVAVSSKRVCLITDTSINILEMNE